MKQQAGREDGCHQGHHRRRARRAYPKRVVEPTVRGVVVGVRPVNIAVAERSKDERVILAAGSTGVAVVVASSAAGAKGERHARARGLASGEQQRRHALLVRRRRGEALRDVRREHPAAHVAVVAAAAVVAVARVAWEERRRGVDGRGELPRDTHTLTKEA